MKQYIKEASYRERKKFFPIDVFDLFNENRKDIFPSSISLCGSGGIFVLIGELKSYSGCIWSGMAINSIVGGYCLIATISNQLENKICQIEAKNENLKKYVEIEARREYNYPQIFNDRNRKMHNFEKNYAKIYKKFLEEFGKILKEINHNRGFQEIRRRVQEDYIVFKSRLFLMRTSNYVEEFKVGLINKVIEELNEIRKTKTEKIVHLISLERKSTWGRIFKGIEDFLPNILEKMILNFYLQDVGIRLSDKELNKYMKDILENKIETLKRTGKDCREFPKGIIMQ